MGSVRFRFVSLNINGFPKLNNFPSLRDFVSESSVACFQETADTDDAFFISGFSKFDYPALRTGGRGSCGLATFIANAAFGNCALSQITSGLDWALPILIESVSPKLRILCVNIYAPR